jgi:hypothetical protein
VFKSAEERDAGTTRAGGSAGAGGGRARRAGSAGFGAIDGCRDTSSSASTLGAIERLGWRLEHVGYYFMVTGETSTDRIFLSGEATAISGVTIGVYRSAMPQSPARTPDRPSPSPNGGAVSRAGLRR